MHRVPAINSGPHIVPECCPAIAVLIPCFNEAGAVRKLIPDPGTLLPDAVIFVYANDSSHDALEKARSASSVVRAELPRGKGNVVRRM
jgi:hypothetical protein